MRSFRRIICLQFLQEVSNDLYCRRMELAVKKENIGSEVFFQSIQARSQKVTNCVVNDLK